MSLFVAFLWLLFYAKLISGVIDWALDACVLTVTTFSEQSFCCACLFVSKCVCICVCLSFSVCERVRMRKKGREREDIVGDIVNSLLN